jgi:3-hydroxyisobutyrate dehydrogenase-like beta-hydroxyacid dehydrogenase
MKVGFIGVGTMGAGMASNMQKGGNELVVNDLTRQAASRHLNAGAIWAESPKAVAESCDVIFTSLPTPADVVKVGTGENGLLEGFRPGSAWFDLSTNAVDVVRALHAQLAEKGVHFLDAPVSGGPSGANSGKLAIWVGGEKDIFDKYKAQLEAMGDQARYIGPIGAGTIAKLVHNAASAAVNVVLSEVFTMGVKAGVEPLQLFEAIRQGSAGRGRLFDRMQKQFLTGVYEPPDFALRLLHKDVSLACQLAREVSVPMRLTNLAHQELTEAMNRGWQGRDSRVAALLQQERAGIPPIKVDPARIKAVMDADGK